MKTSTRSSIIQSAFRGKRVLLTGHTGFKGAWLLQILNFLGAEVKGYALEPENANDLFNQIDGSEKCLSVIGDITDAVRLEKELLHFQPDFIFHFAAQSLVKRSYVHPVDTFAVNVMGTVNVLEAIRKMQHKCVAALITTDKVYENNESGQAFHEEDHLGGHDPYSASKAASEIAIASYRKSFFPIDNYERHQKAIVSLRSGNVIGGGDYAADRIIPDIMRSITENNTVSLRNPDAIRPWQHVLEPLCAYLLVAAKMDKDPYSVSGSYNIGPNAGDVLDVASVTKKFIECYGEGGFEIDGSGATAKAHEAKTLLLDNTKIKKEIGWAPLFTVDEAIRWTAEWYADKGEPVEKTGNQIKEYLSRFHEANSIRN